METIDLAKEIIRSIHPVCPNDANCSDYIQVDVPNTEDDIELDSIEGLIWLVGMLDKLKKEMRDGV